MTHEKRFKHNMRVHFSKFLVGRRQISGVTGCSGHSLLKLCLIFSFGQKKRPGHRFIALSTLINVLESLRHVLCLIFGAVAMKVFVQLSSCDLWQVSKLKCSTFPRFQMS